MNKYRETKKALEGVLNILDELANLEDKQEQGEDTEQEEEELLGRYIIKLLMLQEKQKQW